MDPQPATPLPARPSRFPLFLALLSVFLLLATGFLAYQNWQLQKQITGLSKPTPSPAVALAQEGTANWKTYTNDKMKFTLKYPKELSLSKERYFDSKYQKEKMFLFGFDFNNDKDQTVSSFAIFNFNGEIEAWISQNKNKILPPENDIVSKKIFKFRISTSIKLIINTA